jgi:hypothetical protein
MVVCGRGVQLISGGDDGIVVSCGGVNEKCV